VVRRAVSPRLAAVLALAGAASLAPLAARAQGTAQVAALVDISTTALSIGQMQDVRFGNVIAGVPVTIDPRTNANAGQFVIHGNRNAQIRVTLALPATLTTGTWTMPITFSATQGCWRRQAGQGGCTRFNPVNAVVQRIRNQNAPNNTFYVWVGGTVSPAAVQHTGVYLGTITLTVAYTGN
jgi:hypothetical protein